MILKGKCKKCGIEVKLDVGDMTKQETYDMLKKNHKDGFHCPGHHMELGCSVPHYWDVLNWEFEEGSAPTDEEVLTEMKEKCEEVISSDEMNSRGIITGFAFGYPMTNDGHDWNFRSLPSGKRVYYRR